MFRALRQIRVWRSRRLLPRVLLSFGLALAWTTARAQAGSVLPVSFQAVLLRKVVMYDRTLEGKDYPVIIVAQSEGPRVVNEVVDSFRAVHMKPVVMSPAEFLANAQAPALAILLSSAITPAVQQACERRKILSAALTADPVLAGKATVGFAAQANGKPTIFIHLTRATSEGQDFQAGLLNLARVIR